jgi:MYXO-CTERM domain-containing protein
MSKRRIAALGAGALVSFGATQSAFASEVTLTDCMTDGGNSGDNPDRAFYLQNFPAQNLGTLTLAIVNDSAGGETVTVTAHHATFDGAVIGAVSASLSAAGAGDRRLAFDFGGVPTIPGDTIALAVTYVTDAGGIFLDTGNSPCAAVETNGSSAPLDTFRRNSMGVIVTTRAPTLTAVTPNSGVTAGGSNVSLTGTNLLAPASVAFGDASVTSAIAVGPDGGTLLLATPPNPAGSVDITITTLYHNDAGVDAGAVTTLAAGYTYGDVVIPADSGSISTSDSGTTNGGDGGAITTRDDAGTDNADNGDSSGCSCRVAGDDSSASMVGAILVGGFALFGLRRSKKR